MTIEINLLNKDNLAKDLKFMEYIGSKSLPIYYKSRELLAMYLSDKFIIYKLEFKEVMLGYCVIEKFENRHHIMSIGVLTKYRKRGYGSLIINRLKEDIKAYDRKGSISLYVKSDNEPAIKFYEKNGFKKEKFMENYYNNRFENSNAFYFIYKDSQ